jgi:hypothetical protein
MSSSHLEYVIRSRPSLVYNGTSLVVIDYIGNGPDQLAMELWQYSRFNFCYRNSLDIGKLGLS